MIKKFIEHLPDTKCSVSECKNEAEFEVYLYDYYVHSDEEFLQQDFTCPFLCDLHRNENEEKAQGQRVPRGYVVYPYTNKNGAQGYTKYEPIKNSKLELFSDKILLPEKKIILSQVNKELMLFLKNNPHELRNIDPRLFEEVVADIFQKKGFQVELTPRTRDGGKDIYAAKNDSLGSMLYIIECKRYAEDNPVGVELVRSFFGVQSAERTTMGILASTSYFTADAVKFVEPLKYQLSLRDYNDLCLWLQEYKC